MPLVIGIPSFHGGLLNTYFISWPTIQTYKRFSKEAYWRKKPIERISFLECEKQASGEILSKTRTILSCQKEYIYLVTQYL
jgi:hypothetical protein